MRVRKMLIVILFVTLAAGTSSGCRRQGTPSPAPEPKESVETTESLEPADEGTVRLYFIRGEKIGVAGRAITGTDEPASDAFLAMEALLDGPSVQDREYGLDTVIPAGTTVSGVEIRDGTATVDLSPEFESGGGSLSMLLRIAQVVCTLTQFDGVDSVAFKLDGEPAESIGGEGVIVDPPLSRTDIEGQLPAILVEGPVPGENVSSPLTVVGSSNVFEATHQLNVTDPDGLILVDKTVTATSGTGTRGTWSETVTFGPLKRDGLGAVIIFEYSAKDGSQQNIVEIPVRMKK